MCTQIPHPLLLHPTHNYPQAAQKPRICTDISPILPSRLGLPRGDQEWGCWVVSDIASLDLYEDVTHTLILLLIVPRQPGTQGYTLQ